MTIDEGRGDVVRDAAAGALALAEALAQRPHYGGRVSLPAKWVWETAHLLTFLAGIAIGTTGGRLTADDVQRKGVPE